MAFKWVISISLGLFALGGQFQLAHSLALCCRGTCIPRRENSTVCTTRKCDPKHGYTDCPGGEYCVPSQELCKPCTTDSDCQGAQKCIRGDCQYDESNKRLELITGAVFGGIGMLVALVVGCFLFRRLACDSWETCSWNVVRNSSLFRRNSEVFSQHTAIDETSRLRTNLASRYERDLEPICANNANDLSDPESWPDIAPNQVPLGISAAQLEAETRCNPALPPEVRTVEPDNPPPTYEQAMAIATRKD